MLTRLDVALDYLNHGYCVIPVLREQKKSAVKWKEFQTRHPTIEEVTSWWTIHPEWNIAIVCGSISGCVVVDADSADAIKYCLLTMSPTPFRVKTRKGIHFIFRHPGYKIQSKARVLDDPPVDIRADGGIAIAIGSVHESGYEYCLDDGCDLVASIDLPIYDSMWLPSQAIPQVVISRTISDVGATDRAMGYISKIPNVGIGERNQTAFRVAAILTHDFGLTESDAEAILSRWNDHNTPPLPDHELHAIVQSSVRSGRNPIGYKL